MPWSKLGNVRDFFRILKTWSVLCFRGVVCVLRAWDTLIIYKFRYCSGIDQSFPAGKHALSSTPVLKHAVVILVEEYSKWKYPKWKWNICWDRTFADTATPSSFPFFCWCLLCRVTVSQYLWGSEWAGICWHGLSEGVKGRWSSDSVCYPLDPQSSLRLHHWLSVSGAYPGTSTTRCYLEWGRSESEKAVRAIAVC